MKFVQLILLVIVPLIHTTAKAACFTDSLMVKIVLLEKAVMQGENDSIKTFLLLQKATVYKQLADHANVVNTIDRIEPAFLKDSLRSLLFYEKAFSHFMLRNYQEALFALWQINVDENPNKEYCILYLFVMLENERWEDFNQAYEKASRKKDISADTLSRLHSLQSPTFLDPEHYVKLSKYLPGLGLMQSGYYGKGFTSLGLQLFFIGFAVYNFSTAYYATGLLSGLFPARKFNLGGRILTQSMIEQENQKSIASCKQRGYRLIATLD